MHKNFDSSWNRLLTNNFQIKTNFNKNRTTIYINKTKSIVRIIRLQLNLEHGSYWSRPRAGSKSSFIRGRLIAVLHPWPSLSLSLSQNSDTAQTCSKTRYKVANLAPITVQLKSSFSKVEVTQVSSRRSFLDTFKSLEC